MKQLDRFIMSVALISGLSRFRFCLKERDAARLQEVREIDADLQIADQSRVY